MQTKEQAVTGEGNAPRVNDPNANYAMYERDREDKRRAQTIQQTGGGNAPRVTSHQTANGWVACIDGKPITQFDNPLEPYRFSSERNAIAAAMQIRTHHAWLASRREKGGGQNERLSNAT